MTRVDVCRHDEDARFLDSDLCLCMLSCFEVYTAFVPPQESFEAQHVPGCKVSSGVYCRLECASLMFAFCQWTFFCRWICEDKLVMKIGDFYFCTALRCVLTLTELSVK